MLHNIAYLQRTLSLFLLSCTKILQLHWFQKRVFIFMFEFPRIISQYYIKNQRDATLAVLFISHCKITLHVSDAFCVHHQEY